MWFHPSFKPQIERILADLATRAEAHRANKRSGGLHQTLRSIEVWKYILAHCDDNPPCKVHSIEKLGGLLRMQHGECPVARAYAESMLA